MQREKNSFAQELGDNSDFVRKPEDVREQNTVVSQYEEEFIELKE